MSNQFKIIIAISVLSILMVVGGVALIGPKDTNLTRADLIKADTHLTGNLESSVYLVEFSDFECPACGLFKPEVDKLLEKYKDKITFGYRHFPLPQHPQANYAAYASEAAAKQGKFWEMYDYLFKNQANLSPELIDKGAEELKLDIEKYKADVKSEATIAKVTKDRQDGANFDVNSTPTFFLNGKKLYLGNSADLEAAIEKALK